MFPALVGPWRDRVKVVDGRWLRVSLEAPSPLVLPLGRTTLRKVGSLCDRHSVPGVVPLGVSPMGALA